MRIGDFNQRITRRNKWWINWLVNIYSFVLVLISIPPVLYTYFRIRIFCEDFSEFLNSYVDEACMLIEENRKLKFIYPEFDGEFGPEDPFINIDLNFETGDKVNWVQEGF